MADGDLHTPLLQHLVECLEFFGLGPGAGQIGAVSGGKMAEQTLGLKAGQLGDLGTQICGFFRGLKTDTTHTGVYGKMEGGGDALAHSLGRQRLGSFVVENGGADSQPDRIGESGHRGLAQNQNGGGQAGLPQFQGFQHRTDTEKAAFILQKTADLHSAVAVGIGFDHCHYLGAGLGGDPVEVGGDHIQIDGNIGIVEIQVYQLQKGIFLIIPQNGEKVKCLAEALTMRKK